MDEKELLKAQIKSYEFYAGLIERAVGGGASARLPRWDEQRAIEYRQLADQLRQRLAELEAQEPAQASTPAVGTLVAGSATSAPGGQSASAATDGQAASTPVTGGTAPANSRS